MPNLQSPSGAVSSNSPVAGTPFATTAFERLRILREHRTIAMVGLSANPFRPSHFAAIYMLAHGYRVIPVNPREREILGQPCYATLRDIPEPVEIVDVFREPSALPPIAEDAIANHLLLLAAIREVVRATDLLELLSLELIEDSLEGRAMRARDDLDDLVLLHATRDVEREELSEFEEPGSGDGGEGASLVGTGHRGDASCGRSVAARHGRSRRA